MLFSGNPIFPLRNDNGLWRQKVRKLPLCRICVYIIFEPLLSHSTACNGDLEDEFGSKISPNPLANKCLFAA